jgi:hypothetical protein
VSWLLDVPVDVGRGEAAAAARRELSKAVYADARPSIPQVVLTWVLQKLAELLSKAASAAPGGALGLVALLAIVALVAVVVIRRVGGLRRAETDDVPVFVGRPRSAADYRAAADAAAAQGDWDEAVRQRFRAVVRSLEERDVLDPRPGRTADEAASDAARAMPSCAAGLRAAAQSFDDVAYGHRPRDQRSDDELRELDRRLAATRPLLDLSHA